MNTTGYCMGPPLMGVGKQWWDRVVCCAGAVFKGEQAAAARRRLGWNVYLYGDTK